MNDVNRQHLRLVEALIFASAEPVSERVLKARLPVGTELKPIMKALEAQYEGHGVNLVKAGKSWAFRTSPDLTEILNKEVEIGRAPSRAAVETLAVIAYHQPVTRAEIEEIRGVSLSKGTLDSLFEAGWIKPGARRQTPGRPVTWGTTDGFLDHFGLTHIRDLPGMEDLKAAGLLEAGPAINVYRATGEIGDGNGNGEAVDEADDATLNVFADEENARLPEDGLEDADAEPPEPLDPGS